MKYPLTGPHTRALKLLFCAAVLVSCWVPVRGQNRNQSHNLKVTVMSDSDGQPVPGASCVLTDYGIFAMADLDGVAILEKVPAGKATMEIQMLGYEDFKQSYVFRSDTTFTVRIKESSLALDEVVVTAKASAAGSSTSSNIGRIWSTTTKLNLTKLESLYLTNNLITWSISPKIANLVNLKDLYIDQNANLTGALPKELGQMTKLVNINTSKTGVSGAIPSELSGCTSLKNFMSFDSKLTSIPDNLDKWPALEIIMVYGNTGIEGALPESISNCKTIKTIRFDGCNFTGNIPASYANIPEKQGSTATQLWLKDNKLSGVVPAAVQAHPNWQAAKLWKYSTNILPQQSGYGLTLE